MRRTALFLSTLLAAASAGANQPVGPANAPAPAGVELPAPLRIAAADSPEALLERARRAVDAKDLAAAETLLRRELEARPEHAEARFLLARVLAWQGRYAGARSQYARLLTDEPDNADYMLGSAQTYLWEGRPADAVPELTRARQVAPGYFDLWKLEVQALAAIGTDAAHARAEGLIAQAEGHFAADQVAELERIATAARAGDTWTEIGASASVEDLDRDRANWTSLGIDASHRFASGSTLYAATRTVSRFEKRDHEVRAGFYFPFAEKWLLQGELTMSPTHEVLAKWSGFASIERQLPHGWSLAAGLRHNVYSVPESNVVQLKVQRYWSSYRAAYTLYGASVESANAVYSHAVDVDYFYDDRSFVGLSAAQGREADFVSANQLVTRKTNAVSVRGRHWFNPRWALGFALSRNQIKGAFSRYGVHVGLRHRY